MKDKNKTLGISIPTYKRPEFLKKCVLSAIQDAGDIPIKIFIVDDSVSNVNEILIEELTSQYDFIYYEKNSINIGIDDNIQQSIDFCDCDYSWVIGEDDIFLPGSIERIYNIIQKTEFDFIFANYQFTNEDHSIRLTTALSNVAEGEIELHEFIENYLWAIGFIGACVIKKASWNTTSPEIYHGTYYTHVGRIINIIAQSRSIYFCSKPNVANRAQGQDTFTWKMDSFGVFLGFEKMCRIAGSKNKQLEQSLVKAIEMYRKKIGYFSIKTLLRLRAESSYDYHQYNKYIISSDLKSFKKGCFFLISTIPKTLLMPLVYLHKQINK